MEQVRDKVIVQLNKLGKIKFYRPSTSNLYNSRPLMERVQRKSNELYKQKVEKQKRDYKQKLAKIEKYFADVKAENKRRSDLLDAYEKDFNSGFNTSTQEPLFQPMSVKVPKPVIGIPRMPIKRKTRFHSGKGGSLAGRY